MTTEIVHKVIGTYKPTTKDPQRMWKRLLEITAAAGVVPNTSQGVYYAARIAVADDVRAELRAPRDTDSLVAQGSETMKWHKDNSGSGFLVLWANVHPTELRFGRRRIHVKAGEVVVVNNERAHHRMPSNIPPGVRWFFRQQAKPMELS